MFVLTFKCKTFEKFSKYVMYSVLFYQIDYIPIRRTEHSAPNIDSYHSKVFCALFESNSLRIGRVGRVTK